MRAHWFAAVACTAFCALAAPARADLYRWVDADGRLHVSDDRSDVPPGAVVTIQPTHRAHPGPAAPDPSAASDAKPATAPAPAPAQPRAVLAVAPPPSKAAGEGARVHVLHFQRAGQDISLNVLLGERATCDFKVDTGASINTVPRRVVEELGIEITGDTPRISLVGISGKPALVPLVQIPSVRVGTVYVENVEMAVLDTMSSGLLGLPFFNRFKVQIDPAHGELRLTEVDLAKVDGIYGGMGEEAWRMRFRQLHERLAAIHKARESVPEESETIAQNYLDKLDREESRVQAELDELEDRAQEAGVPANWR
ncbi:MAG TPA: aspartyl protease family protein [Myxococcota bacterium]|nr:aspartyl protease family protein [Myxococcota bacterium]